MRRDGAGWAQGRTGFIGSLGLSPEGGRPHLSDPLVAEQPDRSRSLEEGAVENAQGGLSGCHTSLGPLAMAVWAAQE